MHISKKVNLFIVGAPKAGTTALCTNLNTHPNVYFSPIKEPHFFCDDIAITDFRLEFKERVSLDIEAYLAKPKLAPEHQAYVREPDHYHALFRGATSNQILAEASASYLWSQNAARNISVYNPQARIIIILRNPVERAFSHYLMDLKMGYTQKNFITSLQDDWSIKTRHWGNAALYIDIGLYYQQVKRYLEFFPQEQVLILKHEDLHSMDKKLEDRIRKFIGIADQFPLTLSGKHNTAALPRNSLTGRMINHPFGKRLRHQKWLRPLTPYFSRLLLRKEKVSVLTEKERAFAHSFFEEDIDKLQGVINLDLHQWKSN